ncbi:MAG: methylmalonyl-CoA mutase family protein [Alphaproteobacteria bacterium]|nr:methylmalonyl-CoA mutase family protein [Alphaproteobacteria bacterium]
MEDTNESQFTPLAEGFDEAGRDDWTALVEKALNGRPIDKVLNTQTYEGVTLSPIYRADGQPAQADPSGFPGAMPMTRGPASSTRSDQGWDIRQLHANPEPGETNTEIKADLAGGATSVTLRLDQGARHGGEGFGTDGLIARRVDDIETALAGVDLVRTAISLQAGAAFLPAAASLIALAGRRGVDANSLKGSFGADPIACLAEAGGLPGPLDCYLQGLAALAEWSDANTPGIRAVGVDTAVYHGAGATETQDLGFALATALAYLRAMTGAGMSIDAACRQIGFTLSVGTDVFQVIAKLRAARRLWARVSEVCGASLDARGMALGAATASRSLSQRDIWVNQLRATCACFAAGVGGADSITVRPHTDAIGGPDPLARRVARNIQTILVRESSLARVADPAGGSYYVEQLSDEYARRAWEVFQEIEAAGGMANALVSGKVAEMIAGAWSERERNLARRRDELTGVSSFPDLEEAPAVVIRPDTAALQRVVEGAKSGDGVAVSEGLDVDGLIAAAGKGASFAALSKSTAGPAITVSALVQHRLGEAFEALRDASDRTLAKTERRPSVFVAEIGTAADYTARAVFSKSYFAAAGIDAIEAEIDTGDPAGIAAAFQGSGADFTVICSSDTLYRTEAEGCTKALRAAGSRVVVLAGRAGENEAELREAGVDRFIHAGDDMLASLRAVAQEIGMIEQ